jgi:hypothetical protein
MGQLATADSLVLALVSMLSSIASFMMLHL